MPALAAVLDAIARTVLGSADDRDVSLGAVSLRPHQRDALRRVRASIDSVGGALLADEPGLGKTFVALAFAREFSGAIVVAPAALRATWRGAAATAGMELPFISLESLSRREAHIDLRVDARDTLVIVDEAHHACNPAAARYARLARLTSYRRVLLLSATPVRNRREELAALLALFMGPRAFTLDDAARSHCIVRRSGDASLLPIVDGPHWQRLRTIRGLDRMIARLPPPLPAHDGREATALLRMTLARCWASSLAALDAALRRRLHRGAALESLLDAGRMPTRDELRAWVVGDDAVQLAFPMFAAHETAYAAQLRAVLTLHLDAVRALRARIHTRVGRDADARANVLLDLRRARRGSRIVAFASHAATAEALYRALRRERGVALLTARGARTAGGSRPRADVISALDASSPSSARDGISLVITTDLLSEGVNLQGASVIVHLDIPWTPAGLDQRVGRAARMGSPHSRVYVHGIAAPAAAERMLVLDRRLTRKRAEQAEAARAPREIEQLHALVRSWRTILGKPNFVRANVRPNVQNAEGAPPDMPAPLVANVLAAQTGFIAVLENGAGASLVCGTFRGRGGSARWTVSDAPGDLCDAVRTVRMRGAPADEAFEAGARAALNRWLARRSARESTGVAAAPSRARRELLARIDAAIRRSPAHVRATSGERIARVRALIAQAVSAGAEHALEQLARLAAADLETILNGCETALTGGAMRVDQSWPAEPRAERSPSAPRALRALLLLRRSP